MQRFACALGKPLPVECSELIRGKSSSHAHLEASVTLRIAEELKAMHVHCSVWLAEKVHKLGSKVG